MANLLQSSQNVATQAPEFYTKYLCNLATQGQAATCQAQFVGAQPLQTKAFCQIKDTAGLYQPMVTTGVGYLGSAAGQNITGAASPFLKAGTSASPLCAAKPLICQTSTLNLGKMAQCYMNPFIACQVQRMSDIAQRNIQQNLAPQAVAATVGSGQYGSQRGAQVLGQIQAQAEQCLNANIANLLASGYGQALTAAGQKQAALGQLAQTTQQAQQAQNLAQLQAAQTASQAASQQAGALQAAGLGMGTLGQTAQGINLADVNALATLGAQQQQIAQNQQLFPLQKLSTLAGLLQGYQVPTTVKTTMCMSPFSAIGAAGAGLMGLLNPSVPGGKSPLCNIVCTFKKYFPSSSGSGGLSYNPGAGYGTGKTSGGVDITNPANYPDQCGNLGP